MNIAFECSEYPPGPHGGIGSLVQIQARALAGAGHGVRVIGIYPRDYPAPDEERDGAVSVTRLRLPAFREGWVAARWRLWRTVRRWCREEGVDLVEVPDYGAPAAFWGRLPVPVVTRLSGSTSFFRSEMGAPLKRTAFLLERSSLRRADFVVAESRYIAKRTGEVFARSRPADAVIYNPVEIPDLPPGGRRDAHAVMFAGTLTRKKGIVSLVEAWPAVSEACPSAVLHVWGKDGQADDGTSMQAYLKARIPGALAGSVRFHGHVGLDALCDAFREAAVAVLPSYAEGFALTPLHAMAAACPVIYTNRGSGPELIEEGRTGLLVDPDSLAGIAGAILRLLRDGALARRLGDAGREHVRRAFARDTILAQNEEFYRRCTESFRHHT